QDPPNRRVQDPLALVRGVVRLAQCRGRDGHPAPPSWLRTLSPQRTPRKRAGRRSAPRWRRACVPSVIDDSANAGDALEGTVRDVRWHQGDRSTPPGKGLTGDQRVIVK